MLLMQTCFQLLLDKLSYEPTFSAYFSRSPNLLASICHSQYQVTQIKHEPFFVRTAFIAHSSFKLFLHFSCRSYTIHIFTLLKQIKTINFNVFKFLQTTIIVMFMLKGGKKNVFNIFLNYNY